MIEAIEEIFVIGEAIGIFVANDLTNGALEYHDEFERIGTRVSGEIARAVQDAADELSELEQGLTRRSMFGSVMRIIADVE